MNLDGSGEDSRDVNLQIPDGKTGEAKCNSNRLVGDKDGHYEEDKVYGISEDVRDGHMGAVAPGLTLSQIPQQAATATVCWERFLHVRSIRVLLVENDDSTRHVVTALLRNCSYEVIEAANGIQAWKLLEDLNNHIDLVLTEVVMPYLSGIGLLCKILSHTTRRNTPVIMMSSHDSMGLVFKCFSKGAVDFLVKPIRKNELKNLWQHVWRRCHSSSGSGSESGTQTQKSVKSKSVQKSYNNTGSSNEDNNGSIGLNVGDGSSNGSGTQSSWTKQAVEVDSPRPVSPWDRFDSTYAQVIHSNAEVPCTQLLVPSEKETREEDEQIEGASFSKDLEINVPRNLDSQCEHKVEVPIQFMGTKQDNILNTGSSKWHMQMGKEDLDLNSESPCSKTKPEACVAGFISKSGKNHGNRDFETPNTRCKTLDVDETAINNTEKLTCLEHGSKRHRGGKDDGTTIRDDRNVLRRSESSAFSRYNSVSNVNKPSSGNIAINSLHDNRQDVTKMGPICHCGSNMNDSLPNQYSNVGSNNIDMDSTTDNAFTKMVAPKNTSVASSSTKHSSFQPCSSQQVLPHHCEQKFPHCGSSNVYGVVEGNAVNCSVNGSVSGSNHGSNGPNGSRTAVNAGVENMESDNNARKSGSGDASRSGNRVDQNKISQREAALTKFRQKRKERCFRKKVRYHTRKRLAEERPRVRGQFVTKTAKDEGTSTAEDS